MAKYFVNIDHEQYGPMDLQELLNMKNITPQSFVWRDGWPRWARAINVPELAPLFDKSTYVPPSNDYGNNTPPPSPIPQGEMPNTFLVWNIIATVCCCLVTGIIGIIYSTRASSAWYAGDVKGSIRAANTARNWFIASICCAFVQWLVTIFCLPLSFFTFLYYRELW